MARPKFMIDHAPQRAKRRLAEDPTLADRLHTTVAISLTVGELAAIDARADELRLSRSAYLVRRGLARPCEICGAIDPQEHDADKHGLPQIGDRL